MFALMNYTLEKSHLEVKTGSGRMISWVWNVHKNGNKDIQNLILL